MTQVCKKKKKKLKWVEPAVYMWKVLSIRMKEVRHFSKFDNNSKNVGWCPKLCEIETNVYKIQIIKN